MKSRGDETSVGEKATILFDRYIYHIIDTEPARSGVVVRTRYRRSRELILTGQIV